MKALLREGENDLTCTQSLNGSLYMDTVALYVRFFQKSWIPPSQRTPDTRFEWVYVGISAHGQAAGAPDVDNGDGTGLKYGFRVEERKMDTCLSLCPDGSPSQSLMRQALLPWSPQRHSLYSEVCRTQVYWMLLLHHRLIRHAVESVRWQPSEQGSDPGEESAVTSKRRLLHRGEESIFALPPLPLAVWYEVVAFLISR